MMRKGTVLTYKAEEGGHVSGSRTEAANLGVLENAREEYKALRAEILYCDQICIIIMGALLSGSLALLTFIKGLEEPHLVALLSPAWLIGYLYISEKRFVIETIAKYMREHVETHAGFGWELWLKKAPKQFRRVYPFYLETLISSMAVIGPLLTYWYNKWSPDWGGWISAVSLLLMAIAVGKNITAYARRG